MKQFFVSRCLHIVAFCAICGVTAQAGTFNWKADTTGDWSVAANWLEGSVPTNGDDAVITNIGASAIIASTSSNLNSLMLSRTITFTNWNSILTASNVTVLSNGVISLPAAFTNNQMSNNVFIVCTNLTIDAGGAINVDSKGYAGAATVAPYDGHGPGGGQDICGGSYGGRGADYAGTYLNRAGDTYGSLSAPLDPGSGGGGESSGPGGNGGGAVRIEASGYVLVNGTISANGASTTRGGGSGGGIYIVCNTFSGTNGVIRANGSATALVGGGGGRIAVIYNTTAQAALPKPRVVFSAGRGTNYTGSSALADLGTLYFPDNAFLDPAWVPHSGRWLVPGTTNLAVDRLVVTNATIRFPADGFRLIVTNELIVTGYGQLELGGDFNVTNHFIGSEHFIHTSTNGPVVNIGGNLILTNSGSLVIYAGMTGAPMPNYGASLSVTGAIFISSNCWLYPNSHPTNGGSVFVNVANLFILGATTNGGIDARGRGYRKGIYSFGDTMGHGPGKANGADSGGGYGGTGGYYAVAARAGQPYGDSNAPVYPGSSGFGESSATFVGGNGGGLIWIAASGTILVKGSMLANGQAPRISTYGSGAGGGIYLRCRTFDGDTNGRLIADGGSGNGSGGGGGRIAVWRIYDTSGGAVTSTANKGSSSGAGIGSDGTVVWGSLPPPGTIFTMH